jgi:insulin receptor substrate 1
VDCRKDLVRAELLRKVKTNRLKWFALYPASATVPAHLEYHDSERKWELGAAPARVVVLKDCLNICRQHDTRHRLVLALYTLEDCLSIQFEKEEDLRVWLDLLLSHQKGRADDGKIPQPTYEHMWQVTVKRFDPDDKLNTFTMCGQHRLCVTDADLRFFEMGSSTPLVFPVISLRQCMCNDRFFHLETGRSSPSGAGVLVLLCEDRDSAKDLNIQVRRYGICLLCMYVTAYYNQVHVAVSYWTL